MQEQQRQTYLVADLFCGAGGSSSGARKAIEALGGQMELVAVNHWQRAIDTHSINHPNARHVVEDVSMVNPEEVAEEGRLDLLMASPECTYHSRARGGKPIHDQGRMSPWAIHNWLTRLDVSTVLIENVPEFVDWGPLDPKTKRPIKSRKGEHFQPWFLTFHNLGYQAEWRILNSADYGDATTRTRFFLIARKDGAPIRWPEPTHSQTGADTMLGTLPKWRGAEEIIDWRDPGRSLLDDPKYRKRPLSIKTKHRIAKGLQRFGGGLAHLYIRLLDLPDTDKTAPVTEADDSSAIILNRHGENGSNRCHPVTEPLPTVTCRGGGYLVSREIRSLAEEPATFHCANRNQNTPRTMDQPIPPLTTGRNIFLVTKDAKPFLLGQQSGGAPRTVEDPSPTITGDGAISLTQPVIVEYYGQSGARNVSEPLSAVLGSKHHGLARPSLVQYYNHSDCSPVEAPVPTVTTKDRHAICNPIILCVNHDGDNRFHPVGDPIPTVTARRNLALSNPILAQPRHLPADTDGTRHESTQCLTPELAERLKQAGTDPRRLVLIDGQPWLLDIKFRMLKNSELARAMSFTSHEDSYEFTGNKGEVTKQIGNAVPVRTAAALVSAIIGDMTEQ